MIEAWSVANEASNATFETSFATSEAWKATFEAKVMINEAWNMTSKTANGPVLRSGRMDKTEGRIRQ